MSTEDVSPVLLDYHDQPCDIIRSSKARSLEREVEFRSGCPRGRHASIARATTCFTVLASITMHTILIQSDR
jgi:hypothetical protein